MSTNPFFVGGIVPPEYFIGRKSEIKFAFDLISKRCHGAFFGGTGIGKSSFLNILTYPEIWQEQSLDYDKFYIIYLNCTAINPFTPAGFWRKILNLLKEEIEEKNDLRAAINQLLEQENIDKECFRQILRKIGKQNKYLLLLIDDYDIALYSHESYTEAIMLTFLSEFRYLAAHSKEKQYFCTIVTTFRKLNKLGPKVLPSGSFWYNHYVYNPIKPYPIAEVRRVFFNSTSRCYIRVPQSLQDGILDIAHGHPALLQNAGHLLHGKLQEGKTPDINTFAKDFQIRTQHIFDNFWKRSNEDEQILMMLIALSNLEGKLRDKKYAIGGIENIFSKKAREIIDLEERGIIKQIESEGERIYVFTSSLMEWWVLKELENISGRKLDEELEKREKIFFQTMSREQANKVRGVIKLAQDNQKTLQTAFTWIISKFTGNPT